jgi:aspartyl/glutamyl-tRNA(Asn/Gln) amidotransferase C subunit
MEITNETIEKLERLSMLEIEDKEGMKKKLSEVLTFMENLSQSKDFDIKESESETNFREDTPKQKDNIEEFFEGNNKVVDHKFEVPKIL